MRFLILSGLILLCSCTEPLRNSKLTSGRKVEKISVEFQRQQVINERECYQFARDDQDSLWKFRTPYCLSEFEQEHLLKDTLNLRIEYRYVEIPSDTVKELLTISMTPIYDFGYK